MGYNVLVNHKLPGKHTEAQLVWIIIERHCSVRLCVCACVRASSYMICVQAHI